MRVHIQYQFIEGASGGGNNFLKALAAAFDRLGVLAASFDEADVVLCNGHHSTDLFLKTALAWQGKTIILRMDGLARLYNHPFDQRDALALAVAKGFADGIIFQSQWSAGMWHSSGMDISLPETVIMNAPDPSIFHRSVKPEGCVVGPKMKIVAASWSQNRNKGRDVYLWMDKNLDKDRYALTFVGNAPSGLRFASCLPPCSSEKLADIYRASNVYVTGVRQDACSNALIEAMHCGLPAVAYNGGGNPEIVGKAGRLFSDLREIPAILEDIRKDHGLYQAATLLPSIDEVARRYCAFFEQVQKTVRRQKDIISSVKTLRRAKTAEAVIGKILYCLDVIGRMKDMGKHKGGCRGR